MRKIAGLTCQGNLLDIFCKEMIDKTGMPMYNCLGVKTSL